MPRRSKHHARPYEHERYAEHPELDAELVARVALRYIGAMNPKQREYEKENSKWKDVGRFSQSVACGIGLPLPDQLFAGIDQGRINHRAPRPCGDAWRSPPRRILGPDRRQFALRLRVRRSACRAH